MNAPPAKPRRGRGLARWVARIVPLVLFLAGLYLLNDARVFMQSAVRTEGEVASVSISTSRDTDTGAISHSYRPNIRFTTADGRTLVSPTHISSSNFDYAVGSRLSVLYDPADPSDLRIDSVWSIWLLPGMFTIFGALFLVIFGFFGFGARDRRRERKPAETSPGPPDTPPAPPETRREGRYEDRSPTVRR